MAEANKKRSRTKTSAAPVKKRARRAKPVVEVSEAAPDQLVLALDDPSIAELAAAVRDDGGAPIGAFRDPLGGHPLLLASLPIDRVAPTPFQRDASPAHVKKLEHAIGRTKRFLDPIIVMREQDGRWLTPNGHHRLVAMRGLGARAIVTLVVPDRRVAYQILALNVEKAHNLRERATEVRRMLVDLSGWAEGSEQDFELELDEPALVTLGFAYEARPRLAGAAYAPILRKLDTWIAGPLSDAVEERRRRAEKVVELDDAVSEAVAKLKEHGLTSPYLKAFVVARVNPLRFARGEPPPMDDVLARMADKARALDPTKVTSADLARSSGGPPEEE